MDLPSVSEELDLNAKFVRYVQKPKYCVHAYRSLKTNSIKNYSYSDTVLKYRGFQRAYATH